MGTSIALQAGTRGPQAAPQAQGRPAPVQFRALFSTPVDPQSPLNTGPMEGALRADEGALQAAEGGSSRGGAGCERVSGRGGQERGPEGPRHGICST